MIKDPVASLIAVDLSDGSAITVTADHPFWVDAGHLLLAPSWLRAGHLRTADHLRTASGADVVVTRLRYNVGHAAVCPSLWPTATPSSSAQRGC